MATRYWVGGTGTWNASNTANWSATSGGAGGASAPVAADTVVFDSASGTGTCTTASGSTCTTATLNSSTLGLTLGASHTMAGTFTLTLGTLSLGSFTLSCNIFSSNNSNVRVIAFGTGNITLTGNAATICVLTTLTNFSYTGTPTINATYSGSTGTRTITTATGAGGATETNVPSFNISAGSDTVAVASNVKNLNFTGFTGTFTNAVRNIYGNLTISSGMTCTAGTSSTTFAATSGTQLITTNANATIDFPIIQNGVGATLQLQDNLTLGSTRTFTLTNGDLHINNQTLSTGLFASSNSNTRSIDFKSGNITLTGSSTTIWTTATSTGLSLLGTPTVNTTYSGSTGTRTIITATVAGGATETNVPSFNVSAGSDTVALGSNFKNINFTGFTGTLTNDVRNIYGNLTISSGMTCTAGSSITTFAGTSGTQQITTNSNATIDFPLTFDGVGGTFAFQDALTQGSTRAFTITNGTIKLKAGVTSTVGSFATSGTNQKYLQSTTAGSQATLSQASGTVGVSYLTIQDIKATGGATWNAFYENNNVDAGNNTNWNFGGTPSYDAEYGYKLRSFTERGRF